MLNSLILWFWLCLHSATTSPFISTISPSASVEQFPDYVDLLIRFNVINTSSAELNQLGQFLISVSNTIPIGVEEKASICLEFYDSTYDNSPIAVADLKKKADASAAKAIADSVESGRNRSQRLGHCAAKRLGAHKATVEIERFAGDRFASVEAWVNATTELVKTRNETKAAIVVLISGYDLPDNSSSRFDQIVAAISIIGELAEPKIVVSETRSLRHFYDRLAEDVWSSLRDLLIKCNYVVERSICYYDENGTCSYEKLVEPSVDSKSPNIAVCNAYRGNRRLRCDNESKCVAECKKRLDAEPCPDSCGSTYKNLSMADYKNHYCPIKSRECIRKCPEPTPPFLQTAGWTLMIFGFTLAGASGAFLIVFWLICVGGAGGNATKKDATKKSEGSKGSKGGKGSKGKKEQK